jgi:hypothetical protein
MKRAPTCKKSWMTWKGAFLKALFPTALSAYVVAMAVSGCAPATVVLPADYLMYHVQPGAAITATNGGYLVSDAEMQRILHNLNRLREYEQAAATKKP